jgi:hypothetical protein
MTSSVGATTYSDDDITDHEIARASVPNLGALMKSAVDRGLITPVKAYSEGAAAAARALRNGAVA